MERTSTFSSVAAASSETLGCFVGSVGLACAGGGGGGACSGRILSFLLRLVELAVFGFSLGSGGGSGNVLFSRSNFAFFSFARSSFSLLSTSSLGRGTGGGCTLGRKDPVRVLKEAAESLLKLSATG